MAKFIMELAVIIIAAEHAGINVQFVSQNFFKEGFTFIGNKMKILDVVVTRDDEEIFFHTADGIQNGLVKKLANLKEFHIEELFGVIRTQNRSLELTEERLWQMGYGSNTIHLLFNLWYHNFNYTPAYNNNLPQVDHIFPKKALFSKALIVDMEDMKL